MVSLNILSTDPVVRYALMLFKPAATETLAILPFFSFAKTSSADTCR